MQCTGMEPKTEKKIFITIVILMLDYFNERLYVDNIHCVLCGHSVSIISPNIVFFLMNDGVLTREC